jgi:hypothetical protein
MFAIGLDESFFGNVKIVHFAMINFIAQFGSIIFAIGLGQAWQFVLTTLVNPRQRLYSHVRMANPNTIVLL